MQTTPGLDTFENLQLCRRRQTISHRASQILFLYSSNLGLTGKMTRLQGIKAILLISLALFLLIFILLAVHLRYPGPQIRHVAQVLYLPYIVRSVCPTPAPLTRGRCALSLNVG